MKKNVARILVLTILMLCAFNVSTAFAIQYTEVNIEGTAKTGFNIRTGPGTTYSVTGFTVTGNKLAITRYAKTDDKSTGCETGMWFYVPSLSGGWVCSNGFVLTTDRTKAISATEMAKLDDKGFEAYLLAEGFPSSYWPALKDLHKKYPKWVFKAINTYRIWDNIVRDESEFGMSTFWINAAREAGGYEGYLNTDHATYYNWSTNMFFGYDGSFFLANKAAVAYYLDPRNFLGESSVFMFESQVYNESPQNKQLITNILGTSIYSDQLIAIGKEYNISPIALASRIKQEGTIGRRVTAGNIDIRCNGLAYSDTGTTAYKAPLYNFYNIGAFSSASNADLNGLCYAAQTDASTLRPWNTPEKALKGGAIFIGSGYIFAGQYTTYFQKFNVSPMATKALGHQYMTNIEDPQSSSSIVYNRYRELSALTSDFVFYIPYYIDMPASAVKAPALGNPNNWLTSLSVGGVFVSGFKGNTTNYTVNIGNVSSVKIDASAVAKTSYVAINGGSKVLKTGSATINTPTDTTNVNIVVTAGNGTTKTYTITLKKNTGGTTDPGNGSDTPPISNEPSVGKMISDSNLVYKNNYLNGMKVGTTVEQLSKTLLFQNNKATITFKDAFKKVKTKGALATGDTITITSNNETKTIEVIIYGDITGSGTISIKGLLAVQKHIIGDTLLKNVYLQAADVDKDGKVTIKDLLLIQKDILGDTNIKQL